MIRRAAGTAWIWPALAHILPKRGPRVRENVPKRNREEVPAPLAPNQASEMTGQPLRAASASRAGSGSTANASLTYDRSARSLIESL